MKEYWKEILVAMVTGIMLAGAELWRSGGEYGAKPVAQCQPEADVAMWQGISNSSNPADFMEYLTRCPNGNFVGIAKNRLQELYKPNPPSPQLPIPPIDVNKTSLLPVLPPVTKINDSYTYAQSHTDAQQRQKEAIAAEAERQAKKQQQSKAAEISAVEFVKNYYQLAKQIPYEESWAKLSDNFKLKTDFDIYKQWWDTVDTIQLTDVEQINQNTVKVVLQRSMKNGRKVCSVITSQIVEHQNGWFIDKQERKNCESKQSKNIQDFRSS